MLQPIDFIEAFHSLEGSDSDRTTLDTWISSRSLFAALVPGHIPFVHQISTTYFDQAALIEVAGLAVGGLALVAAVLWAFQADRRRRQMGHRLAQSERLTGQLLKGQDEDKRRLARELHDGALQHLAALSMSLETLDARETPEIQHSVAVAKQCAQELRSISFALHPPMLDVLGLAPALEVLVEDFSKATGTAVKLQLRGIESPISQDIDLTLLRVVEEALTSIHRRSGAKVASVSIHASEYGIDLEITGQDNRTQPTAASDCGSGVLAMQERFRVHGGKLEVRFTSTGTTIAGSIPRRKQDQAKAAGV